MRKFNENKSDSRDGVRWTNVATIVSKKIIYVRPLDRDLADDNLLICEGGNEPEDPMDLSSDFDFNASDNEDRFVDMPETSTSTNILGDILQNLKRKISSENSTYFNICISGRYIWLLLANDAKIL